MAADEIDQSVLDQWRAHNLAPLWRSPTAHKPPAPPQAAHLWEWSKTRPLLEMSFTATSPEVVERRGLQYLTPYSKGPEDEYTVGTMLACVQCLLPGETARPHRHSMGNVSEFRLLPHCHDDDPGLPAHHMGPQKETVGSL